MVRYGLTSIWLVTGLMEIPNFALKWEPKITEFYFSLVLSVNF